MTGKVPTLGSLFTGIGGFDCAFEREGFKTAWQCEIDEKASAVLAAHWPEVPRYTDITKASHLPPVDVIAFGSPCQDLSVAGLRAGLAGERSGLFFEAIRVIKEMRDEYGKPDFIVWENVPGAFSSNHGADFAAVLDSLADIGALDICWRVLDAQNFGVPQRRRRIFLVADFGGERAGQVLFEPEGVCGDSQAGCPPGEDAEASLAASAGSTGGYGNTWNSNYVTAIRTAQTSSNGYGFSEETYYTLDGANGQAVFAGLPDVAGTLDSECGGQAHPSVGHQWTPCPDEQADILGRRPTVRHTGRFNISKEADHAR